MKPDLRIYLRIYLRNLRENTNSNLFQTLTLPEIIITDTNPH